MAEMTLAEQTGRRLLLAGLAAGPALAAIRAWNAAVLKRKEVTPVTPSYYFRIRSGAGTPDP